MKNLHIYASPARCEELKAEYDYCARNATRMVAPGHLVVLALAPAKKKEKKSEDKAEQRHDHRRTNGFGRG